MMENQKNIMFCGFGGQGILLAGVILGKAAVFDGLNAAQAASYGAEARGSACRSEVIISRDRIVWPHIEYADILGVMSQQGYDRFWRKLSENEGVIFYDSALVKFDESLPYKQEGIPATEQAIKELGNKITANIVFLSALVKATGIVSAEGLEKAVRDSVPERFLDVNLEALRIGEGRIRINHE